jgi:hypothetical protein
MSKFPAIPFGLSLVLAAGMIILMVFSLRWVYRDAKARGFKEAVRITVCCAMISWPFSMILYHAVAKETPRRSG